MILIMIGDQKVGSIAGHLEDDLISNSYGIGSSAASTSQAAGAIGNYSAVSPGDYLNVFWNSDVNAGLFDLGNSGGEDDPKIFGETTANLKLPTTYTSRSWDFANIWTIDPSKNNGYPILQWQP